jgi:Fe-Mn family superoxide dismutase
MKGKFIHHEQRIFIITHVLPPLPYAKDALSPVISAETIDFHSGIIAD